MLEKSWQEPQRVLGPTGSFKVPEDGAFTRSAHGNHEGALERSICAQDTRGPDSGLPFQLVPRKPQPLEGWIFFCLFVSLIFKN